MPHFVVTLIPKVKYLPMIKDLNFYNELDDPNNYEVATSIMHHFNHDPNFESVSELLLYYNLIAVDRISDHE